MFSAEKTPPFNLHGKFGKPVNSKKEYEDWLSNFLNQHRTPENSSESKTRALANFISEVTIALQNGWRPENERWIEILLLYSREDEVFQFNQNNLKRTWKKITKSE